MNGLLKEFKSEHIDPNIIKDILSGHIQYLIYDMPNINIEDIAQLDIDRHNELLNATKLYRALKHEIKHIKPK